jgi:hypothetical protein
MIEIVRAVIYPIPIKKSEYFKDIRVRAWLRK